MSRNFSDLQMLRNLLPEVPEDDHGPEQALLNVISWMYANAVGDVYDGLYDAIVKAYVVEYDFT